MTTAALVAFTLAAALLTVSPGLDTALVLRTAIVNGARAGMTAGIGIALGCFIWGVIAAFGLGALLAASQLAYDIVKWLGAAYLLYLGAKLILSPRRSFEADRSARNQSRGAQRHFGRGLLTNLLNPKVGIFYISFLPQFIPAHANVVVATLTMTAIHGLLGIVWFALLCSTTRSISRVFRRSRVIETLDRLTGCVFIAFGAKLAFDRR